MATLGRTLFRFGGALLLGASATAIDDLGVVFAPTVRLRNPTIPVVVATRDVPEGVVLDRGQLGVAQWPAGTRPGGAYNSVDSVAGRVARVTVYRGEAIVQSRVAPVGTRPGLEVKITPGKRAYSVRFDGLAGVAGMIQPNSRVDLFLVVDGAPGKRGVAGLLMENMRVLAIGAAAERATKEELHSTAVVTLEVSLEEAERLAIASARGVLQLALRGYGDPDSVSLSRGDRMPVIVPRRQCDPPAETIVRDLLRRACGDEMRFMKDSPAAGVVPRR